MFLASWLFQYLCKFSFILASWLFYHLWQFSFIFYIVFRPDFITQSVFYLIFTSLTLYSAYFTRFFQINQTQLKSIERRKGVTPSAIYKYAHVFKAMACWVTCADTHQSVNSRGPRRLPAISASECRTPSSLMRSTIIIGN